MSVLRIFGTLLLAAALLDTTCLGSVQAATAEETPQEIVQAMVDQLSHAVIGHQAELHGHPEQLTKIIDNVVLPNFDLPFTSLLVLGQYASATSPAQRVAFNHAFDDALARGFAKGLIDFTQVRVTVLPSEVARDQRRTLVRTQVLQSNGQTVAVDYAFRRGSSGQWKIYDVIIEGISYITLYRSQVVSQFQQGGIDAVIKRLQTRGIVGVSH
ncbi:MAG: ABC transporter substrate-binding protein [Rhodanobacter sp.]|nr:MAG: ABC transporter substrate-binding protein [Rhodanobacter sp.]TAL92638.1 MAG: ABC transporter substrate-binding protein [Rhodanobacter sp.]TAM40579.1 MAG: ABC transporter substrate-binding protein [Rhodanobacter sp.]